MKAFVGVEILFISCFFTFWKQLRQSQRFCYALGKVQTEVPIMCNVYE